MMEWTSIVAVFGLLGTILGIYNIIASRGDKKVKDTKEQAQEEQDERINIATMNIEISHIKDDIKEMRGDMKDIKQLFLNYKDDVREIAKEAVYDVIRTEIRSHELKYHDKGEK